MFQPEISRSRFPEWEREDEQDLTPKHGGKEESEEEIAGIAVIARKRRNRKSKILPLMNADYTDRKRKITPRRRGGDQIAKQKPKASSWWLAASGCPLVTITVYPDHSFLPILNTKY
jgi:hypothetical protein